MSGDLFKVVERTPGRDYALFLADVSGKGIGAALLTASLKASAQGVPFAGDRTVVILRKLD